MTKAGDADQVPAPEDDPATTSRRRTAAPAPTDDVSQARYHGPARMYGTRKKFIPHPKAVGGLLDHLKHGQREPVGDR